MFFLVFILLVFVNIHAQEDNSQTDDKSFEIGFLIEATILNSNTVFLNSEKKDSTINTIHPFSLFLSGRIYLTNNLCLEFRPGLMFPSENYTGLEYGFYLRYYFNKFYLISGVNFHDNIIGGHGQSHYVEVFGDTATLIHISVGYKMSNNLSFSISYYHPLWEYKIYQVAEMYQPKTYEVYLTNIFKVGCEYAF